MNHKICYHQDVFNEDPRRSEPSEDVVRYWLSPDVNYLPETQVVEHACRAIVAERVFLRLKILNVPANEQEHMALVSEARPFGAEGPTLAELMQPCVKTAMVFVPLTPAGGNDSPCLVRLYGVAGLPKAYRPTELVDGGFPGAGDISWFLSGLPDAKIGKAIKGRSWRLAAEFVARIVTCGNSKMTEHLARHFIVTGDVVDGKIVPIEMGRKVELAKKGVFKDFKWIIPGENEMSEIGGRKIEKPSTLEEALELIETLQNKATRVFFEALHTGNLNQMKTLHEMGADLFACDKSSGLMPLEIVGNRIRKERQSQSGKLDTFNEILSWLRANGADCALMFYMLAKVGLDDALKQCLRFWPIEARSADGLNATELALKYGDVKVARKLYSHGCKCRSNPPGDSFLSRAIERCFNAEDSRQIVLNALAVGLSPYCAYIQSNFEEYDGSMIYGFHTSLFGAALKVGDIDLVERCLKAGADPNGMIKIYGHTPEAHIIDDEYQCEAKGSPLYIMSLYSENLDDYPEMISGLLYKYGAKKDARVERLLYGRAVGEYLGSFENNRPDIRQNSKVFSYIDEGQPIGIKVSVKYVSAEDDSKCEHLSTTLWGAAVYYGDVELMRKCLEHGVSVSEPLRFEHRDGLILVDHDFLNGRPPAEIILMNEDVPLGKKHEAIRLLEEYGLLLSDIPEKLRSRMHTDVLAGLVSRNDVYRAASVVDDFHGGPIFYDTDIWGMAVFYGWSDVMERCMDLGMHKESVVKYWIKTSGEGAYVGKKGVPCDIVLDVYPMLEQWEVNRIKKLLRRKQGVG